MSNFGRCSGGVSCFVEKTVNIYFERIIVSYDNAIIFKVSREFLGLDRGVLTVLRLVSKVQDISVDVFLKLFDAQIQTNLLYGAEIWGMENCHILENAHLYAMKKCLRVPIFTPNVMIYGDTGRYELWINAILRSIKYWVNPLTAKLFNLNFHPLEVVSR